MAETPGDVVAIAGTLFADRMFGSVGGMGVAQRPYHELRGEVGLEGPKSQG